MQWLHSARDRAEGLGNYRRMLENYLAMGALNALALMILFYMVWRNGVIEQGKRAFYLLAILATEAVVLAEMGTVLFEGGVLSSRPAYLACNVAGFALTPAIPILLAGVFGVLGPRSMGLTLIPCLVNALLSLLSPFYGLIFSVSESGAYRRGDLFAAFVAAYLWGMLVLLKATLDMGKRYRYRFRYKLFAVFGFILLGTSLQVALPNVHTSWTCVALALALHYGFICEMSDTLDALTKLYNRKSYECEIERLKDRRFAVVLMDVDDFKRVNDRYGHPYGDECLATLASLVHEAFYRIGDCYRIGGDEFCVLCRVADEEKIAAAIARLVRGVEDCRARDPRLPVISYGFSAGARDEAIREADRQMYRNKARRKAERQGEGAS